MRSAQVGNQRAHFVFLSFHCFKICTLVLQGIWTLPLDYRDPVLFFITLALSLMVVDIKCLVLLAAVAAAGAGAEAAVAATVL